jgi:hypothetical protein
MKLVTGFMGLSFMTVSPVVRSNDRLDVDGTGRHDGVA